MIQHSNSQGYLLLFRGTDWHRELSPEEIQSVMGKWGDWVERLTTSGKMLSGQPLENEGYVISGKSRSVADGPFAESKEAVGGYFYLKVDTIEEAIEIGSECPALPHGISVEVRPIAPQCPAQRMVDDVSQHAIA